MAAGRYRSSEYREIMDKLADVQADLRRFAEQTNQQHLEIIVAGARREVSNALVDHVTEDIGDGLEARMIRKCDMRETCRTRFNEFLQRNAMLLNERKVEEDTIAANRKTLAELRKTAPYKKCDICFTGVSGILEREIGLLKSLQIYRSEEGKVALASELPEETVVAEVLDPVSNKSRLQILKALYYGTRTFTALSDITGLRSGNLLFHIQKLSESSMIIQRHDGGDYMITEKGYRIITGICDIYADIAHEK